MLKKTSRGLCVRRFHMSERFSYGEKQKELLSVIVWVKIFSIRVLQTVLSEGKHGRTKPGLL